MDIYTVGDCEFPLKDIFCISKQYTKTANAICVDVYSKGGGKVQCTIEAVDDERRESVEPPSDEFEKRVTVEMEKFRRKWRSEMKNTG